MLLACELPIVLAVIGLGSLSAAVAAFRPPLIVEIAGVVGVLNDVDPKFRTRWFFTYAA